MLCNHFCQRSSRVEQGRKMTSLQVVLCIVCCSLHVIPSSQENLDHDYCVIGAGPAGKPLISFIYHALFWQLFVYINTEESLLTPLFVPSRSSNGLFFAQVFPKLHRFWTGGRSRLGFLYIKKNCSIRLLFDDGLCLQKSFSLYS